METHSFCIVSGGSSESAETAFPQITITIIIIIIIIMIKIVIIIIIIIIILKSLFNAGYIITHTERFT